MPESFDTSSLPGISIPSPDRATGPVSADRLATILIAGGYILLVGGLSLLFGALFVDAHPLLTGLAAALIALLVLPARNRIRGTVHGLTRRKPDGDPQAAGFTVHLAGAARVDDVAAALRDVITQTLQPAVLHIFLFDPLNGQYMAASGEDGKTTSDLRFDSTSPLVELLRESEDPLPIDSSPQDDSCLQAEMGRLRLLGARWYVPLQGGRSLAGWVAIGERAEGGPMRSSDVNFLQTVAQQAAQAIERCLTVTRMEMRIREMDGLGRVAQGVNVTIALDDIFELIYAQTTQIIPADDFQLVLLNGQGEMVRVFCVAGDDRLTERENAVLPADQTLEYDVIHRQKPMQTDDFQRECRQRNLLLAAADPIFAWVSVPLNAGAETIGALSLGRRDPSTAYTVEQVHLLQAIADQVAGAIVKTRLLEETERRARQLATLNEVTGRLTSTLELDPLLDTIVRSAVEILNCQAGSLLLLDEQKDDLVYRATYGLIGRELLGKCVPVENGFMGQAIRNRTPLIVQDPAADAGWEISTGFALRDLLIVPLVQQDKPIGVVEAYNPKDRSPFNQDDMNLLSAFAAQAAVAISNARLYMLTDRALAARVEELSVMQRIDRELNTSLDTSRAMRITLDWAMRQSGANAGLIGMICDGDLQVMEAQGYTGELDSIPDQRLPLVAYGLEAVVRDGLPESGVLAESDRRMLENGRARIVIPIRRESSTVGLLYLETASPEPCSQEALAFLARLSDHASIAIANAELYTAVEAANVAKSEFVSFVAHELKNPMTSIKGYTELLAAGAVGAVNEAQANFLATIRSNIDRMNTLVSDLNDLSKIEAGRLRLEFKALSLSDVIEEVVRSVRRQVEYKEQELLIELPADLPLVWADRTRLTQVLVNLVSNAHKYTEEEGTITVGAKRSHNRWDAGGAGEVLHVWVHDNGIGINEEDQKKIFQKFFRSEDPKTREVTGSGLGLNITRSLVEMQGGKIWFDSEFRNGTTFHFTVPTAEQ